MVRKKSQALFDIELCYEIFALLAHGFPLTLLMVDIF